MARNTKGPVPARASLPSASAPRSCRAMARNAGAAEITEWLEGLLEASEDAVVGIDEDRRIIVFGASAERIFGYPAEEVIGQPVEILLPERLRAGHDRHVERFLHGAEASRRMSERSEVFARRKDGEEFPAQITLTRMHVANRRVMVAVVRDVSDRHHERRRLSRALSEASESSRARSAFLSNISHELRTPLNAIIGFSEIMSLELHGTLGDERYEGYTRHIHDSARHLLELINDLLALSEASSGELDLRNDETSVADAVEDVVSLLRSRLEEAGVLLVRRIPGDLPPLCSDAAMLRRVLWHLVSNAVKFTPSGGRIEVTAGLAEDGAMTITVADNGVGIEPGVLRRVREGLAQGDDAQIRRCDGAGFGLVLTQTLMAAQGGELRLSSQPGNGTEAVLVFPQTRVCDPACRIAG